MWVISADEGRDHRNAHSIAQVKFDAETHVTVVIPTLNEERVIESVIRGLVVEKTTLPNLSIMVVDGGSSDRTPAIVECLVAEFPFLHLMHNPKRIQSAAVNLAAESLGSYVPVLVRCDAHAIYPAKFVESLLQALERTGADSVVVPMDTVGRTAFESALAILSDTPLGSGGSRHRGGRFSGFVDHGHHAAFRLSSFLAIGGYDETFRCNEDAEFDSRLNLFGGRVYLDADIRIAYHPRSSFSALARQYFHYGQGRSRTVRRHPHTFRLRQAVVPMNFLLVVASCLAAAVTGRMSFFAWPSIYLATLSLASLVLFARTRKAYALLIGVQALTLHMAWATGFFTGLMFLWESGWQNAGVGIMRPRLETLPSESVPSEQLTGEIGRQ